MSVHSKVNCRKIQKYHGMYIAYVCINKMNKTGDSYLPCIAMAHSPQVGCETQIPIGTSVILYNFDWFVTPVWLWHTWQNFYFIALHWRLWQGPDFIRCSSMSGYFSVVWASLVWNLSTAVYPAGAKINCLPMECLNLGQNWHICRLSQFWSFVRALHDPDNTYISWLKLYSICGCTRSIVWAHHSDDNSDLVCWLKTQVSLMEFTCIASKLQGLRFFSPGTYCSSMSIMTLHLQSVMCMAAVNKPKSVTLINHVFTDML